MKKHLNKIVAVLVHVIVVGAMFSIIALAAVGLGWGVKTLEAHKLLSEYSVWLLTMLEHVILTLDVVGVLRYIIKMVHEEFKGD